MFHYDPIPDPDEDPEGYQRWLDELQPDDRPDPDAHWPAATVIVEISPGDGAA